MRTSTSAVALRQARLHLLEHGDCPPGGLDDRVARSWQRSLAAGLLPADQRLEPQHTSGAELTRTLAVNRELVAHSRPVMDYLFEQVRQAQGMVILADQVGTLVHTLGHADFLGRADRVALSCGANWHEKQRGTNAIGTALVEAMGVEIHGAEHFLERNEFLTCTAVPIRSAQGEVLGVLDISGDQRGRHPHTLGLVSMASRMIENRLISAACKHHLLMHLHAQPEGIGSLAGGIVALSEDGWMVGANRAAMDLLHLSWADLGAAQLGSRLDISMAALLSQHSRQPGLAMRVRQHDGGLLFVRVERDALACVSAVPGNRPPESAAADALHSLDTGDARWRSAANKARRVLDKPIPLLIQGESGVGKELFARAAHDSGPRRNKPFIAINCAAVPENLIEAELFGYAPGAFTGARREGSLGRLREAHGGTLFLDEIGDMPAGLQARLLRVLQERQVVPLGGGPATAVDFALICASHRKLREEAMAGRFRNDLFYRINGLTVALPPLRERTDFLVLTRRLLDDLNPDRFIDIEPRVLDSLVQHAWPGNLRQYASALRTASAMLEPHETQMGWQHMPDDLVEELSVPMQPCRLENGSVPAVSADLTSLKALSRSAIFQALDNSQGNLSQAAKSLGISRQTIYRKLGEERSDR